MTLCLRLLACISRRSNSNFATRRQEVTPASDDVLEEPPWSNFAFKDFILRFCFVSICLVASPLLPQIVTTLWLWKSRRNKWNSILDENNFILNIFPRRDGLKRNWTVKMTYLLIELTVPFVQDLRYQFLILKRRYKQIKIWREKLFLQTTDKIYNRTNKYNRCFNFHCFNVYMPLMWIFLPSPHYTERP